MKKFLFLFFPFFFFGGAKAQQVIPPPADMFDPNGPVMAFDSLTYTFGEATQGKDVIHEFHFKNTGKMPLAIQSVNVTDPMVPDWPKDPILPGKTGIIRLRFYTYGKMGPQHKYATVHSNNRNGDIVLHLKGKVVLPPPPAMKFDSTSYTFGKVKQGERVNLTLHFTNTGKEPLIINQANTACGCDVAEASREPVQPGGSGVVKYTLDTTAKMGMQAKTITITYNTSEVVVIQIHGEVVLN